MGKHINSCDNIQELLKAIDWFSFNFYFKHWQEETLHSFIRPMLNFGGGIDYVLSSTFSDELFTLSVKIPAICILVERRSCNTEFKCRAKGASDEPVEKWKRDSLFIDKRGRFRNFNHKKVSRKKGNTMFSWYLYSAHSNAFLLECLNVIMVQVVLWGVKGGNTDPGLLMEFSLCWALLPSRFWTFYRRKWI